MKRLLLLFFALHLVFAGYSQSSAITTETDSRKNDVLLDPVFLISGVVFNTSYERIIAEDQGIGLNVLIGLGARNDNFFQASPYFRMYFGEKRAQGFFLEGFVPITSSREYISGEHLYDEQGNWDYSPSSFQWNNTIGLGFGLGKKWILKRNILMELSGGVGRRFFGNDLMEENVTGKLMFGLGYRF